MTGPRRTLRRRVVASGLALGGGTAIGTLATAMLLQAVSTFDLWHLDGGVLLIGALTVAMALAIPACDTIPLFRSMREALPTFGEGVSRDLHDAGALRGAAPAAAKSALIAAVIVLVSFAVGEPDIGVAVGLAFGLGRMLATLWYLVVVGMQERRCDCRYELATSGSWGWLGMPLTARRRNPARPVVSDSTGAPGESSSGSETHALHS